MSLTESGIKYQDKINKILEIFDGLTYQEIIDVTLLAKEIARNKAVLNNKLEFRI